MVALDILKKECEEQNEKYYNGEDVPVCHCQEEVLNPLPKMKDYMKPFQNPGEDRRPTLTWPRQIPIAGEPEEVVKIAYDYELFLSECNIPKLFINADPGSILVGKQRERARLWPNQKEVTVKGGHFIQEISPHEIGEHIKEFLSSLN